MAARQQAYSLFIGARPALRRIARADDALMDRITQRHFPGGFSILSVRGRWSAGGKKPRREEARQILVTTGSARRARAWAVELGRALGQKEILLVASGPATTVVLR